MYPPAIYCIASPHKIHLCTLSRALLRQGFDLFSATSTSATEVMTTKMTTSTTTVGQGAGDPSTVGETIQTTGTTATAGDIDQYGVQVAGGTQETSAGASIGAASLAAVGAAGMTAISSHVTTGDEVCLCRVYTCSVKIVNGWILGTAEYSSRTFSWQMHQLCRSGSIER